MVVGTGTYDVDTFFKYTTMTLEELLLELTILVQVTQTLYALHGRGGWE